VPSLVVAINDLLESESVSHISSRTVQAQLSNNHSFLSVYLPIVRTFASLRSYLFNIVNFVNTRADVVLHFLGVTSLGRSD